MRPPFWLIRTPSLFIRLPSSYAFPLGRNSSSNCTTRSRLCQHGGIEELKTRTVDYAYDGLALSAFVAGADKPGSNAGFLVCHEGPGQNDHARNTAIRLATEFDAVAVALDYHGDFAMGPDPTFAQRMEQLDSDRRLVRSLGSAGLDVLRSIPSVDSARLAVVGYCFGGTMALELARAGETVLAVAAIHPGLATTLPAQPGDITCEIFVSVGTDDPIVSADDRVSFEAEMRDAEQRFELLLFGGVGHGFTNPDIGTRAIPGLTFDAAAASRSWDTMSDFFRRVPGLT